MKLWVDDEREPPDRTWLIARSVRAATELLRTWSHGITHLSLDHDLGDHDGYSLVTWMESRVHYHGWEPPDTLLCHSMNPVGRERIQRGFAAMRRANQAVTYSNSGTNVLVENPRTTLPNG